MSQICPVCTKPIPLPKFGRPANNKKYCSDSCRQWNTGQILNGRRKLGYDLLKYMEKTTPTVLKRLLKQMEKAK